MFWYLFSLCRFDRCWEFNSRTRCLCWRSCCQSAIELWVKAISGWVGVRSDSSWCVWSECSGMQRSRNLSSCSRRCRFVRGWLDWAHLSNWESTRPSTSSTPPTFSTVGTARWCRTGYVWTLCWYSPPLFCSYRSRKAPIRRWSWWPDAWDLGRASLSGTSLWSWVSSLCCCPKSHPSAVLARSCSRGSGVSAIR